jgi:aspartate aminotransferase-like enzyme
MQNQWPYRLLAPGPVPIPTSVLQALSKPPLHHRTPVFNELLEYCFEGLKKIYRTSRPVLIQVCTGSGVMESAVVNTLSPGDEVLCIVGGKFGERWAEMCRRHQIIAHELKVEWGKSLDLIEFTSQLKKHSHIKAVLVQACETSTATVFPIEDISKLTHEHTNALVIVDAITAMGCMDLPMDKWKLDVVVAGSQKAFMLPTGLGFIGLSARAEEAYKVSRCAKFYFDWGAELKTYPKATHFSSANSMVVALAQVLKILNKAGATKVKQRCESLAKTYSENPSNSVTALSLPENVKGEELRLWLEERRNITIMGGQDQLKGKVLRIGHMGAITNKDMHCLFQAIAEGLEIDEPKTLTETIDRSLSNSEEFFL